MVAHSSLISSLLPPLRLTNKKGRTFSADRPALCGLCSIRDQASANLLSGPAVLDILQYRVQVGATDVVNHSGPERACANRRGHQVRTVEAEYFSFDQEFSRLALDGVGIDVQGQVLVREDGA